MDTKKPAINPKITKAVSRAFFLAAHSKENPDASKEQTLDAWAAVATEHQAVARKALNRLAARGVTFTLPDDMSDAKAD